MSYGEELMLDLQNFAPYNFTIIRSALKEIRDVLKKKDNKKEPKKGKTKEPKKGHHVINNGVNKLYKDMIKKFFEKFWHPTAINVHPSLSLIERRRHTIDVLSLLDPLTDRIKDKISKMTTETPNDVDYENKNALNFSCAKIALLACVHCMMLDIHNHLQSGEDPMPQRIGHNLQRLSNLINNKIINKDDHGVYVDSEVKRWWDKKNPDKVEVFEECKKSIDFFLKNIAGDLKLVMCWGQWFYCLENMR